MPVMQFVNGNVSTTATADATSGAASIAVASTSGFPGAPFTILIPRTGELMYVSAITAGPAFTVVRGYGGTTAAAVIGTGGTPDTVEYSITREMLLLGFPMKLDEDIAIADRATGTLALSVPSWAQGLGLRGLKVVLSWCAGLTVGNGFALMRLNGDSSATYNFSGQVGSTSGFASIPANNNTQARIGYVGTALGTGTVFHMSADTIELQDTFDSDRYTKFFCEGRLIDGGASAPGVAYEFFGSGDWRQTSVVTSLAFASDNNQNGVWAAGTIRAGSRAILYGIP